MATYTRGSIKSFFGQAGLKAYYTFDNGNKLLDESGNGYHLTAKNSTLPTPSVLPSGGFAVRSGTGNTTYANSNYFYYGNNIGINNSAHTILAWVRCYGQPATNEYWTLTKHGGTLSGNEIEFGIDYKDSSGTKYITFWRERQGLSFQTLDIAIKLKEGKNYLLVLTYDGTNLNGYINGKFVGTISATGSGANNYGYYGLNVFARSDVGATQGGGFSNYMEIDEIAYYLGNFSNNSIAAYYQRAISQEGSTLLSSFLGSFSASYILALAQGSYTLTGQVLGLIKAWLMSLVQGAYTLTGNVANLLKGWLSTLAQGSYSLTGFDVIFYKGIGYVLTAAQGAYVLTGEALTFLKNLSISLAQGSYTLAGQVMFLFKNWGMAMVKGVYTLTGEAVALSKNMYLALAQGAYTITGQAINLIKGKILSAITGFYTLSGKTVRAYLNGNLIGLWKKVGIATDRVWRKVSKHE